MGRRSKPFREKLMLPLVQSSSHNLGLYCSGRKKKKKVIFSCLLIIQILQFSIFGVQRFMKAISTCNQLFFLLLLVLCQSSLFSAEIKEPVTQYTEDGQNKRKHLTRSRAASAPCAVTYKFCLLCSLDI